MKRILSLLLILSINVANSQSAGNIVIDVIPNKSNWLAGVGDKVSFDISVKDNSGTEGNVNVYFEIGPDMIKPFIKDSIIAFKNSFKSKEYTLKEPGFLRCIVTAKKDGKEYKKFCTVGFDVENIKPTQTTPQDFTAFWSKSLNELKSVPLNFTKELLPNRSTVEVDVYRVSFSNINGSKVHGMLAMPSDPGKYPAVLQVPGAGVRPYGPDINLASNGVIVLTIGIHGIPVDLDSSLYKDLNSGALRRYFNYNANSKEDFYYKRVYLGCVRANDILTSLSEWDGKNLVVTGGSQGGALSIVTAALDKRVTALAAYYPALSDLTGYLYKRAGGWPHYFAESNNEMKSLPDIRQSTSYYDVVNFAAELNVPGFYSWGYNDIVCPPTSMYAAYNNIKASKKLSIYKETGHWTHPQQKEELTKWIINNFKK